MAFDVLITDEAFADLDAIAGSIKLSSLATARKWVAAIIGTIKTLKEMPRPAPIGVRVGRA